MTANREGIDRITAAMRADGLTEGHYSGAEIIEAHHHALELPDDERDPWLVCAMCLRTMRRKGSRRVEIRPGVLVCPMCASQPQAPFTPPQIDLWLPQPVWVRREKIALQYRVDPATAEVGAAPDKATVATVQDEFVEDVDGLPAAVRRVPVVGVFIFVDMPRTYWQVVRERGRGIL